LPWFKNHLLADGPNLTFVILTPPPDLAPHSSLVRMFETVRRELGSVDSFYAGKVTDDDAWALDYHRTMDALHQSQRMNRPLAVLGTAFSFVHLLEHLAETGHRFVLPTGSRVMETGGYKGRSRRLPRSELHAAIHGGLGVPESHIVCEYGMSELSSQAYDRVAGTDASTRADSRTGPTRSTDSLVRERMSESGRHADTAVRAPILSGPCASTLRRIFRFPPWARSRIVSAETGREVAEGESGLIQVYDLANVRSVMAVQTEDLGVRCGDGFELLGRGTLAEPRGCSLMNV
jgi:hypothetical protein